MNLFEKIKQEKYLLLKSNDNPLSISDILDAKKLLCEVPYEKISVGDSSTDDDHNLLVGRYRRDEKYPMDLHLVSQKLMKIINNVKMQTFYRQITQFKNVCIRRAQANILEKGGYIGLHVDGEGSSDFKTGHKDYKYAVVVHFENNYKGGDTVILFDGGERRVKLPDYSLFILSCDLPHKIDKVTEGTRKTIAYFISDSFGLSQEYLPS